MLKGNARSLNKLMRLHFLSYILSYILHIVTITYIVTCFIYIPTLITYIVIIHTMLHTWLHNYMYHVHDMPAPAKGPYKEENKTKNPRLLWKWVGGSKSHSELVFLESHHSGFIRNRQATATHVCITSKPSTLTNFPWVSRILAISQGSRPGDTKLTDICEPHGMLWPGNTIFFSDTFIFHQWSVRTFQHSVSLICWILFVKGKRRLAWACLFASPSCPMQYICCFNVCCDWVWLASKWQLFVLPAYSPDLVLTFIGNYPLFNDQWSVAGRGMPIDS